MSASPEPATLRLLATMLFASGADPDQIREALGISPPAVIVDLEDMVAPSAKAAARTHVGALVQTWAESVALHVRINALPSREAYDDLDAVVNLGLAGIVVPKVEHAWQLEALDWALGALEERRGVEPGTIELTGTIESVAGVRAAAEVAAAACPRLKRLCFGSGDFSRDVGLEWPHPSGQLPPLLTSAKVEVALASRSAGLEPPHDGVYPRLDDPDGLRREAEEARVLGYWGKHAYHPSQVGTIIEVYAPSEAELDRARRMVAAYEAAERRGQGLIEFEGRFANISSVARARTLLREFDRGPEEHGR